MMRSIQKSASRAGFSGGTIFASFDVHDESQLENFEEAQEQFTEDAKFLFEVAGDLLTEG